MPLIVPSFQRKESCLTIKRSIGQTGNGTVILMSKRRNGADVPWPKLLIIRFLSPITKWYSFHLKVVSHTFRISGSLQQL